MSSLPAVGGHKAEIAIKPEHVVSSSSGYYPVKSEEVETDNEEDTNTSKINIKDEHHRVKVEVKTEDDISTDDECSSNNNKSAIELKSPQLADTQATSEAIVEKDTDNNEQRKPSHGVKLASSQKQVVAKTKRKYQEITKNNSANSFWKLEDDTRSRAEEAIRLRVGYRYHVACNKRICITTYSSISSITRLMTIKGPLYHDSNDFTRFCTKFKESDLDDVYPKVDGRGELFPPPQYLARGELIRKWRQFSEAEQLNICNNHILPSNEDEEAPPPVEPLTLPKDYMGTISDKKIDELALKVNLCSTLSLTGQVDLNPTRLFTSIKAPIHVTGCSRNWGVVLHSIRYFYELDNAQQLEEIWKERYLLPSQRRHYKANIRHLHSPKMDQEHIGRWTEEEHEAFLSGLQEYGKEWKKVADHVKTRTVAQTRSHAQKYFQKMQKEAGNAQKYFQS